MPSTRAPRNRTLVLTDDDRERYASRLTRLAAPASAADILDATICQDLFAVLEFLPAGSVDLLFADPPYNLTKAFNSKTFTRVEEEEYEAWVDSWLVSLARVLKPTASVYICADWRSSVAVYRCGSRLFRVRNRITWERDKGRGAGANWKNNCEDIWFFTVSDRYTFNLDAVKVTRRVLAPYTGADGEPKDWDETREGRFRTTHPSNIWTDLTIPFWSMPENTDHPTQKPEKLLAKIILASSNPGDVVLDPFLGSGTTSVAARKLGRRYIGIEADETYCLLAAKRLERAKFDPAIQGYSDGVFWERNTLAEQKKGKRDARPETLRLFGREDEADG